MEISENNMSDYRDRKSKMDNILKKITLDETAPLQLYILAMELLNKYAEIDILLLKVKLAEIDASQTHTKTNENKP